MKVEFEGVTRTLDTDHIRLKQARVIQGHTGLSIDEWAESLNGKFTEGDEDEPPRALPNGPEWLESVTALYWLMLAQSGEDVAIDDVDFDVSAFWLAFVLARAAEMEKLLAELRGKPDPQSPRGQKAAGTASRARNSRTATTRKPPAQRPAATVSAPPVT